MKNYFLFFFIFSILVLSFASFAKNKIVGVEVKGNSQTKKFVILNLMNYKKGEEVDVDALEKAQSALIQSNFFTDVYMSLKASGEDYVLLVDLKEENHTFPLMDLEKGIGMENNDVFGLGIGVYGTLRFFNTSPLEFFYGGYSIGTYSPRILGSHFSFESEYDDLSKLPWQTPVEKFKYDLKKFVIGVGYTWNKNSIMGNYTNQTLSTDGSATVKDLNIVSVGLNVEHKDNFDFETMRNFGRWNISFEHGLSEDYNVASFDIRERYRIIAQIYSLTRFYAAFNGGEVPFTSRHYLGQTTDLKGYDLREFTAPLLLLLEEKIGVPLTSKLGISKSKNLTFLTPELILQSAFVGRDESFFGNLKFSVGLGVKFKTSFGAFEPELFFGKALKFYLEFGND